MSDQIKAIARDMNNSMRNHFCPTMKIGAVIDHPDGYKVKIISGRFLDPQYGRVSNWWTWQRVEGDGSLGPEESGYGW